MYAKTALGNNRRRQIVILLIFYWYFIINMMTFNFVIRDYTIFKLMFKLPSQLFYIVI